MQDKVFFEKFDRFFELLSDCNNSVIAYSGGVDSSFLAKAAQKIMLDNVVCVLLVSPLLTAKELDAARKTVQEIGLPLVELASRETEVAEFVKNDSERCYYCKKHRLEILTAWSEQNGYKWVLDGSNADDLNDYRPGMKATKEFSNTRSPLLESGMTKQEIRSVARQWGLSVWDKPSLPCLATRIKYNTPLTQAGLDRVQAAEEAVAEYCPPGSNIRVRVYDELARIEVDKELFNILLQPETANVINDRLQALGFAFVTLDLAGFKSGSMNSTLKNSI